MRLPVLERVMRPAGFDTGPLSISAVRVLRISVTDRCNLRCGYCMPVEGLHWLPRENLLSFEEIEQVVRSAIEIHGIRNFKLTGGEPTVRHGLVELIARLRRIDGLDDLSMTTNGILLDRLAAPLKDAGLDRITVSIDSLMPERFRQITRNGELASVLCGLDEAERVGFDHLKINCVTMRGINDDEITDFARLTLRRRVTVRFIEYMPLGDAAVLHADETGPTGGCGAPHRGDGLLVSESEARARLEAELGPLVPVHREVESGVGPSSVYRLMHGSPVGRIGFISAMSRPFCSTCNRLRLTADGRLRSCLFDGGEVHLRAILRANQSDAQDAIADAMTQCVRLRPELHSACGNEQMSRIGG